MESYLTLATTGNSFLSSTIDFAQVLIQPNTLISQLLRLGELTATKNMHQWSHILKLLPIILSSFDTDKVISDLQKGEGSKWIENLSNAFQVLSQVVAVGLYADWYTLSTSPTTTPVTLTSAISFHNSNTQLDSQFSFQSQQSMQFDGDATLDIDNTQQIEDDEEPVILPSRRKQPNLPALVNKLDHEETQQPENTRSKNSLKLENAAVAARIMIHLIEKRDVKRIFEVYATQRRHQELSVEIPWAQCQARLEPTNEAIKNSVSTIALQNPFIQKLLVLVQRLTDRDLEKRLAVHIKYHELEDEGTARAMPSAGLMGIMYHMVQIRPTLDDDEIIDHLLKLQAIKGSFDESFYLELWLTALTGLRESLLNTSCQSLPVTCGSYKDPKKGKGCSALAATNRLLWRSLVLVKLPHLIHRIKFRKEKAKVSVGEGEFDKGEYNSLEASLQELKAFTGLINACSPPECCPGFYAPDSMPSTLVDRIASSNDDEEDDIMKMINDLNSATELNTPLVTKSIRLISNNDIFTNIVNVCERYGFVRSKVAQELLKKEEVDNMMDVDHDPYKVSPAGIIDQVPRVTS